MTAPAPHSWHPNHLRLAIDAAGVALWSWNVDDDSLAMDKRGFDLWGLPWSEKVSFEELSAHIHPEDRDRVGAAFAATRAVLGPYETDFRVVVGDEVRWVAARGQGDDAGIIDRVMFGIFLDVTGRKQAEEGHELLAGEMSHRVKNLLAIASGLTSITSRSATSTEEMADDLIDRLGALGRAHDLVRPLPGSQGKAAILGDLLTVLLAPYEGPKAFGGRIRVAVERTGVGINAATTLALVIHELATNSLKYGALAVEAGTLDVTTTVGVDDLTLVWMERGGRTEHGSRGAPGFGSNLIVRSITGQLGGSISHDWSEHGLTARITMSRSRLAK